jgi:hypothetical protein
MPPEERLVKLNQQVVSLGSLLTKYDVMAPLTLETVKKTFENSIEVMDIKISPTNAVAAYGNTDTTLGITIVYRLPLGSPQLVKFNIAVPGYLTEDTTI